MRIRDKALTWFNSLGKNKREELSIDYYGTTSLFDMEIVDMYFEEVPHKNLEELISVLKSFSAKFLEDKEIEDWVNENLKM